MKITLPGRSRCRAESTRAAPASIAVCRSWPQACIAPSISDANGSPVVSVTGSASMSARSSTTGPGLPPRSTAVTELSSLPRVISSGSPSSAASTFACVLGQVEADLGLTVNGMPELRDITGYRARLVKDRHRLTSLS